MPVLSSFMAVEENYRRGAEDFRGALEDFDISIGEANKKLRRFGVLSDWHRRRRVARGETYYSPNEVEIVDSVAASVDKFLDRLPISHLHEA